MTNTPTIETQELQTKPVVSQNDPNLAGKPASTPPVPVDAVHITAIAAMRLALSQSPSSDWELSRFGALGVILGGPEKHYVNGSGKSQILMTCVTDGDGNEENKQAINAKFIFACNPKNIQAVLDYVANLEAKLTVQPAVAMLKHLLDEIDAEPPSPHTCLDDDLVPLVRKIVDEHYAQPAQSASAVVQATHPVTQILTWASEYEKEGGHALIVQMLRAYAAKVEPTEQLTVSNETVEILAREMPLLPDSDLWVAVRGWADATHPDEQKAIAKCLDKAVYTYAHAHAAHRCAALEAKLAVAGDAQAAWLIEEVVSNHSPSSSWWIGGARDSTDFSFDPNRAVRFSRREDAESALAYLVKNAVLLCTPPNEHEFYRVTEHQWHGTSSAVEPTAEPAMAPPSSATSEQGTVNLDQFKTLESVTGNASDSGVLLMPRYLAQRLSATSDAAIALPVEPTAQPVGQPVRPVVSEKTAQLDNLERELAVELWFKHNAKDTGGFDGRESILIRSAILWTFNLVYVRHAEQLAPLGKVEPTAQPKPSADGPTELWLQLHGDCLDRDRDLLEPVDYTNDDVTWCWHSIHDSDVRYVRADLALPTKPAPIAGGSQE